MKTLSLIICLITSHLAPAAEVWWLEMDKVFYDALIKRFSDGDPEACRQIGDRLPALIKEGKIKEIEWVTSDSKTGGRHFPTKEVESQFPDGRKEKIRTGSILEARSEDGWYRFWIRTPGNGFGNTLEIRSHAQFDKQWQPLFAIESGGRIRVLMGHDPSATEDFRKPRGHLSVSAPLPEATKLTWVLFEGHPLLAAAAADTQAQAQKAKSTHFSKFTETSGSIMKTSDNMRSFGSFFEFSANSQQECSILMDSLREKKGVSNIAEVFTARGSGKLESTGKSFTLPVKNYVETISGNGDHENVNEKISGDAVVTITLFP